MTRPWHVARQQVAHHLGVREQQFVAGVVRGACHGLDYRVCLPLLSIHSRSADLFIGDSSRLGLGWARPTNAQNFIQPASSEKNPRPCGQWIFLGPLPATEVAIPHQPMRRPLPMQLAPPMIS